MRAICLVGIGKIAVDQHVPAIVASPDWMLAATVSRAGAVDGVPAYTDFAQMLAERPDIDTVSLCLPPVPRYDYAAAAIAAGRHVKSLPGGRLQIRPDDRSRRQQDACVQPCAASPGSASRK